MSLLEPDRIERRYAQLVELGHSRLPALAPRHTDHNAHDPGITLMELLAAVAEAQLYSVGRIRRDERDAYAALFGVKPRGTRPARGLLWPQPPSPDAAAGVVIGADAAVRLHDNPALQFRPLCPILWAPGRLSRLALHEAGGAWREFGSLNQRGVGFMPFGERAGPNDVLVMSFETVSQRGLFPPGRPRDAAARWAVGVRVAGSATSPAGERAASPLSAVLVTDEGRFDLPITEDTSAGMLRSGHLLLDLSSVEGSPARFCIEWRAPRGLARAPRLLRLEPNVVPVTQRLRVHDALPPATGSPGFSHVLQTPGLCFEPDAEPVRISVAGDPDAPAWRRCDDLAAQGPADRVFEFEPSTGRLLFGNGLNGQRPAKGLGLSAAYEVSDGEDGNVARNRQWTVEGIAGVFGSNLDAVTGGTGRSDRQAMRRESRRRLAEDRALVSADDICRAAQGLPLLGVARCWMAAGGPAQAQTATLRLVALRARADGVEPAEPPETARWLAAVGRALAPRLPLGMRLAVVAPAYRGFSVRATLTAAPGRDPATLLGDVMAALALRVRLVPATLSDAVRAPGVPVTQRDVAAWLLTVPGVADVTSVVLIDGSGAVAAVRVPRDGLPRLDLGTSRLDIRRPAEGARP